MRLTWIIPGLIMLVLMGSCRPSKTGISTTESNKQLIKAKQTVTIYNNVLLGFEPWFAPHYAITKQSLYSSYLLNHEVRRVLENMGYTVNLSASPMVRDYFQFYPSGSEMAEKPRAERIPITDPVLVTNDFENDTLLRESLSEMMRRYVVNDHVNDQPFVGQDLDIINQEEQSDLILFNYVQAKFKPTSKIWVYSLTVGLVSALTGIYVSGSVNASTATCISVLIDAHSGQVLWSNHYLIHGRRPDDEKYFDRWSKLMFYHFPNKTKSIRYIW